MSGTEQRHDGEQVDHGLTDHGQADHGQADHGQADHGQADHGQADQNSDLSPAGADQAARAEIAELVGQLTADTEGMDTRTRGRKLSRLARLLSDRARKAGAKGMVGGRWLSELLMDVAPHLPLRDLATLQEHHHGLTGERLADNMVKVAANGTTAVGAAGGALAAVQYTAPPLLLAAPARLAAETLVVAAIEVKLIGELHEVYGVQLPTSNRARAVAFLTSWAKQRGVNPLESGALTTTLGAAGKKALRKRMLRTFGRGLGTMGPFLTGAAAGGALNRMATKKLAETVRKDLRRHVGKAPDRPALRG